jgi:predicted pyridoxine 5'-phosphate oxidase superfamily flavin-nucleotide-binding protein
MAHNFGSFVFTPVVKALQEKYGSRRTYERLEKAVTSPDRLSENETSFIAERDSFYMASVGATGWPYIQHRGGPKGFVKVVDDRTIAFADFSGNKQFISAGNLMTDARVALIMVDYPGQARLKILGHAEIVEGTHAKEWAARVRDRAYKAAIERVFIIRVDAFDWNCPQHITPRFTADEIQEAVAPIERHVTQLEEENERLRKQLADVGKENAR